MANIRKTFNFREGVKVDDSVLVVAGQRVGIGSTIPSKVLDINGDVISSGQLTVSKLVVSGVSTLSDVQIGTGITIESSSGIITANKFFGDGSTLSNIPTSQWTDTDVGLGFTSIYNSGNVGVGTTDPRSTLQIGSDPDTVGKKGVIISALTGNIKSSGIITATEFHGDGSNLTNVPATGIGGTVANANIANYAHVAGIATVAQGLTGTPNITVGSITASSGTFSGSVNATTFVGSLTGNASSSTVTSSLDSNTNYTINGNRILSAGIGSFGSVGIGTTNAQTDLQIFNANNSVITLGRSASATGDNGAISFGKVVNSFPYSGAKSLDILNYSSGNINFYLEAGSIGVNTGNFHWHRRGNFAQLMTLTHQGSLGIGETQPNHNLHVVGTSTVTSNAFFGNNVNIKGDANVTGTLTVGSFSLSSFTGNVIGNLTGNVNATSGLSTFKDLKVTGNSELQGNVGIGTTADVNNVFALKINSDPRNSVVVDIFGNIGIKTTEISAGFEIDAIQTSATFGTVGVGTTAIGKAVVDFSNAGKIGAGTTANRFMLPPILTGSERSGISQVLEGALIYNSDNNRIEVYNGTSWQPASAGGASGISNVVDDSTPELGGDLNINGKFITGTGGANITGIITATTFSGSGGSLTSIPAGQLTGTVDDARLTTVSSSKLSGALPAISGALLTNLTGAFSGTYGSSSLVPIITVDSNGRITGIATTSVSGGGGSIAGISTTGTSFFNQLNVSGVSTFGEGIFLPDNKKAEFGNTAGNADLEIFHTGASSVIRTTSTATGGLNIRTEGDIVFGTTITPTDDYIKAIRDGAIELYYDGAKKLETTTDGVVVTGILTSTSFVKSGGTSSQYLMADGSVSTGGGGGGITIQDEGSALSTAATTLNFVGAGVTASGTGATKTITISGGGGSGSGGTVSSGTFTASQGSPSTLETYAYDSAELVFEYTVFVKQTSSSKYQTQKLLVMRDGTTVTSTQYGIMYSSDLLVQLDATISGSNLLLRATPETGINGTTTYRVKREVT